MDLDQQKSQRAGQRTICLVMQLLLVLILVSAPVIPQRLSAADTDSAAPVGISEPDPDKLRILGLRVGSYVLEDLVTGYAIENSTYLPLGAIADFTDMAIQVRLDNGTARGFIFREDRRFFLDIGRAQVTLSGKTEPVNLQKIRIYPDDIYIEADTLSKWMPFNIDVDLFSSLVTLTSEEKLPFEQRIERERRYKSIASARQRKNNYPKLIEPYQQWTAPKFTATLRGTASQDGGSTVNSGNYSLYATNDVYKLESSVYLAGDNAEPLRDARITLGRKDPDSNLLGRLHASEYAFGSIDVGQSPYVTRSATLSGAFVSTYPINKPNEYDRQNFIGELPDGWEVELYQNNALIGLARSNNTGQYRFEDIPLYFGNNYFRLVFYGPQGQKREESRNFNLSDLAGKPGEQFYRLQSVLDDDAGTQDSLSFDRVINKKLSLHLGYDQLTLGPDYLLSQPAQRRQYANVGIKSLLGGFFVTGDHVKDMNNGQLSAVGLQTRVGRHSAIGAKYAMLDNFTSERFPKLSDPTKSVSEVSLNSAILRGVLPRIPVLLRLQQEQFASGATRNTVENRLSTSVFRMAMSNSINYIQASNQSPQTTGLFQLSKSSPKFNVRSDLNYSLQPSNELTNATLTFDGIRAGNFVYGFSISHTLSTSTDQFNARLSRTIGKFAINADATVNSNGGVTAGFGITAGIGYEPRSRTWTSTAKPMAGMGAASVRVFLDENDDGIFGEGDQPIAGVRIKQQGNPSIERTNERGIALITNLPPYQHTEIEPALEDLEDPLWVPSIKGVSLVPRPGATSRIDIPIIRTGEIDGTTYLLSNNRLQGVGDVELELINAHGKLIKTIRSASDGFYVISEVPVGEYLVRVSPEQIRQLGLFEVRPVQVKITSKNQFISGINFRLQKQ